MILDKQFISLNINKLHPEHPSKATPNHQKH